jgi:hypothetical protein
MQSEHEHRTPPDAVVPPSAPAPKREKEHVGRYSEGEEKLPDSPEKQHVGRYSNGFKRIHRTLGKFHIRKHRGEQKGRRKT